MDGVDVVVDRPLALGPVIALAAREVANVAVHVPHVRLQDRLVEGRELTALLVAGERLHVSVHLVNVIVDARELVGLKVAVVVWTFVIWKRTIPSYSPLTLISMSMSPFHFKWILLI